MDNEDEILKFEIGRNEFAEAAKFEFAKGNCCYQS